MDRTSSLLDEPTNHLDVDSREALVHALNDYEGAVILISHDRHLIETSADRLWLCDEGTVLPYDGDLDDYRKLVLKSRKPSGKAKEEEAQPATPAAPQLSPKEQRRLAAQQRDQIKGLRARVREFETKMNGLQKELEKADAALADPKLYEGDPTKAQDLAKERAAAKKALDQVEQEWLEATETYEQAQTAAAE